LLVDLGFLSLAIASFSLLAKVLPILPASNRLWHVMEAARWNRAILQNRQADYKQYAAAD
jgi:hypothetical protein